MLQYLALAVALCINAKPIGEGKDSEEVGDPKSEEAEDPKPIIDRNSAANLSRKRRRFGSLRNCGMRSYACGCGCAGCMSGCGMDSNCCCEALGGAPTNIPCRIRIPMGVPCRVKYPMPVTIRRPVGVPVRQPQPIIFKFVPIMEPYPIAVPEAVVCPCIEDMPQPCPVPTPIICQPIIGDCSCTCCGTSNDCDCRLCCCCPCVSSKDL